MPRAETSEIIAITDRVSSEFGMRRLTQAENDQLETERLDWIEKARISPKVRDYLRKSFIESNQSFPILARYRIDHRDVGLLATKLHTYYLTVSYVAQGKFRLREGSNMVEPSDYMPEEHKILKTAKQALEERFGYDRVFIAYYHPINF
jgi:hypothetical protein